MSVIRRPGVLGETTQRRITGVTSALSAAAIEALTVGTWFALVAVESRTVFTALAGLGVLLFGSLLRTGVIGSVTPDRPCRSTPMRIVVALTLAGCWLVWLLTAEWVGGTTGVAVAGIVLVVALTIQFALERRAFYRERPDVLSTIVRTIGPSILLAIGATVLLIATWYVDWSVDLVFVPIDDFSLVFEIGSITVGFVIYGLLSFLAQQRRFQQLLT